MRILPCLLVLAGIAAGGCATSPATGRAQLTSPAVSQVYSNAEMQFQLLASADSGPCTGVDCVLNAGFDRQVQRLGTRLAAAAYEAYPDLRARVPNFEFRVVDKAEPGTASNSTGTVVVQRGVYGLHLDEEALAFVIAREMGHVIAGHHDENSARSLVISVLAQVLLPIAAVPSGLATAASTVASFAGSRLMKASHRPDQTRAADAIALQLLARQGWSGQEMDDSLVLGRRALGDDGWSRELRESLVTADTSAYYVPAEAAAEDDPAPVKLSFVLPSP